MSVVANGGGIGGMGGSPSSLEATLRAFADPDGLKVFATQAQKIVEEANANAAAIRASAEETAAKAQALLDEAKASSASAQKDIEGRLAECAKKVEAERAKMANELEAAQKAADAVAKQVLAAEARLNRVDEIFAERERAVTAAENTVRMKFGELVSEEKRLKEADAYVQVKSKDLTRRLDQLRAIVNDPSVQG